MNRIIAIVAATFVALVAFMGPASATGSDSPTPYTVDANGVTLPTGDTFPDGGHVNIKYTVNGGPVQEKGIHFESLNNQPSGQWIGKSNLPWSAFELSGQFCVTWVQVSLYNEHFGEGGQQPFCAGDDEEPDTYTKDVTLCHFENGIGNRINVSTVTWYDTHREHGDDIWEAFSYKSVGDDIIHVNGNGNADLLEFEDCKAPVQDIKVVPSYETVDECGTDHDAVELLDGTGYEGSVSHNGLNYTVTATTTEGYVFDASQMEDWTLSNQNHKAVIHVTLTDEDCDLPVTGGVAQHNWLAGVMALGASIVIGGALLFTRRKRS